MLMTRLLRSRSEAGFTLVELLVVLVLLGVVGGVVVSAITTGLRSSANTTARITALQELEIALQRMTGDLRAANPLQLSTTGNYEREIGARIDRDGSVTDVTYEVRTVAGVQQLIRVDTGQTLVSLVDNGGEPVFRYLDEDGEDVDCSTDCSTAYLQDTSRIEIRLVRSLGNGDDVRAITSVGIRSLRYGGVEP